GPVWESVASDRCTTPGRHHDRLEPLLLYPARSLQEGNAEKRKRLAGTHDPTRQACPFGDRARQSASRTMLVLPDLEGKSICRQTPSPAARPEDRHAAREHKTRGHTPQRQDGCSSSCRRLETLCRTHQVRSVHRP